VKNRITQILQVAAGLFLILSVITACNDRNDLGLEILPGSDLINVKNVVVKDDISAFTFSEEGIVTSGTNKNLLGSMKDPVFGSTTVNFATQFRLRSFPDFGDNPTVDSTKLFLYYKVVYGDTITPHQFKVYELEEGLSDEVDYTQDIDLKAMASDQLLGELQYTPKIVIDSTSQDTSYQLITIPLDNSLGEKLATADSLDLVTNDVFLNYFKGLYIESEKVTSGEGSLLTLEASASSTFQGSALVVYYDNDENQAKESPDTLSQAFVITQYSVRANNIQHDYIDAPFLPNLNQENEQEENIYVQPMGGIKSRILITDLEGWKDSVNTAINKAELVFHVDTIASDIENFAPPGQLLLTYVDTEGNERLPVDYYFNPLFYGGFLYEDHTYRFNITQHLQQIIDVTDPSADNYVGNQGFYLTTGQRSDFANRVVLEGAQEENGIQLLITYSKYSQ
jgi:hypothetical protein